MSQKTNEKKVAIGLKVTESDKTQIVETAERLGMNTSQYLEAMIFNNHPTINAMLQRPLQLSSKWDQHLLALLQPLKQKYPQIHQEQMIAAALKMAIENENRIISNKLQNYL